jgi:hypothetical protein
MKRNVNKVSSVSLRSAATQPAALRTYPYPQLAYSQAVSCWFGRDEITRSVLVPTTGHTMLTNGVITKNRGGP